MLVCHLVDTDGFIFYSMIWGATEKSQIKKWKKYRIKETQQTNQEE